MARRKVIEIVVSIGPAGTGELTNFEIRDGRVMFQGQVLEGPNGVWRPRKDRGRPRGEMRLKVEGGKGKKKPGEGQMRYNFPSLPGQLGSHSFLTSETTEEENYLRANRIA